MSDELLKQVKRAQSSLRSAIRLVLTEGETYSDEEILAFERELDTVELLASRVSRYVDGFTDQFVVAFKANGGSDRCTGEGTRGRCTKSGLSTGDMRLFRCAVHMEVP